MSQVHQKWTRGDIQTALDTILLLLDKLKVRPSQSTEILEDLATKTIRRKLESMSPTMKARAVEIQTRSRLLFSRHLDLKAPHAIIYGVFGEGTDLRSTDPFHYHLFHARILGNKGQWKHHSITRFEEHVERVVTQSPHQSYRSVTDADRLRGIFSETWNFENHDFLFYWGSVVIDWQQSSARARDFWFRKL